MADTIDTAVILAAGQGTRLHPYTIDKPKCLVEVGGKSMLEYTLQHLESAGYMKLVIVTGFKHELIDRYIEESQSSVEIQTIVNPKFDSTNNSYSLWMIRELVKSGFLLIESDLILKPGTLDFFSETDRIGLDKYDPDIHDGTTVTINEDGTLRSMYVGPETTDEDDLYKTVNIYSFSKSTWNHLFRELDRMVGEGDVNGYYETAIRNLARENKIRLKIADFSDLWWDEIDTPEDLERVEAIITENRELIQLPTDTV